MRQPLFQGWELFLLRAPVRALEDRPLGPTGSGGSPADGRAGYLDLLVEAARKPTLREAVTLASPSLARVLERAGSGEAEALSTAQLRRAALAALRYDIRMRSRPTPFGLFAGVTCGRFEASPKVEWGPDHRTRTYPDMDWLMALVREWERDPAILAHLRVQAHGALVVRGGRVFLDIPPNLGVAPGAEGRGSVSVRHTAPVRDALAAAATPIAFGELVEQLRVRHPAAPEARIAGLLRSLVEQDLLITALRPPLDGGDPLRHVVAVLTDVEERTGTPLDALAGLRRVGSARDAYDRTEVGAGLPRLRELTGHARAMRRHDTPVHVDTRLDLSVHLPRQVREEVERAADALWRLSPPRRGMRPLRPYHAAFLDRYGPGRLVPLLELLDENRGLGAPAGYEWPASPLATDDAEPARAPQRERVLAELVARAVRDGAREVVLDDALIDALAFDTPDPRDMPGSCELYVHVVSPSVDDLAAGEFRVVVAPNPGSHHAGGTMGRFVDLLGPAGAEILDACRSVRPRVPGALPVDVVFQPRSPRAANIAHTPGHTGRRIGIGLPDAEGVEEIRLADVAVTATLERMLAVHVPTGRELTPVAPHMLSPGAQAPNPARLLWELGQEGRRMWEPWDWGGASPAPFLPRVRYGRAVLNPATWKLGVLRADLVDRDAPHGEAIRRWREAWRVPARILLLSTDQRLAVDLDNPWHRELLVEELRRDPNLVAQEQPGGEDYDGWLADGSGHRGAEVVVPLVRRPDLPAPAPARFAAIPADRQPGRRRGIGSDWLFLKLYGSWPGPDQVLRDHLPRLVHAARQAGVRRWFFIRYSDPRTHLRLRLQADPGVLWGQVLPLVSGELRRWQDQGLVGALVVDEYDPEWERYAGPAAQAAVERVFEADSEAAIALLTLLRQPGFPYDLDTLSVISLASLAAAFGAPSPGAEAVPQLGPDADPAAAWLAATGDRREVPATFRPRRRHWCELVDPAGGWPILAASDAGRAVLDALRPRDAALAAYGALVRDLRERGDRSTPELRIVGSLLHMTCNRLFGGDSDRERDAIAVARAAVLANLDRRRHTR